MLQVKRKVSKKKRRFVDRNLGVDLDLSYITPSVVAMGFPSEGKESLYRNPMNEVKLFLETYHKDHYKVYNLCSERTYDPSHFKGRVYLFPFDDHNCPNFQDLWTCCVDLKQFIEQGSKETPNVGIIHCKAGKGRTGLVICCYLLFSGEWKTAKEAMAFYAAARTYNQKGVTIPSQIRYIQYFEKRMSLPDSGIVPTNTMFLSHLVLVGLPSNLVDQIKLSICKGYRQVPVFNWSCKLPRLQKDQPKLREDLSAMYRGKHGGLSIPDYSTLTDALIVPLPTPLPLEGDVKFKLDKIAHFWLNTSFESTFVSLAKCDLDKAAKDKSHKVFPKHFRIDVLFRSDLEMMNVVQQSRVASVSVRDLKSMQRDQIATRAGNVPAEVKQSTDRFSAYFALASIQRKYPSLMNL